MAFHFSELIFVLRSVNVIPNEEESLSLAALLAGIRKMNFQFLKLKEILLLLQATISKSESNVTML